MMKGIYSKTINYIITGDGILNSFETGNGVIQRCPLSPTLAIDATTTRRQVLKKI